MQHDNTKLPQPTPPSDGARVQGVSASRRALLRAGTAAAPVVLTLASGPVAATSSCVLASSFVSVAVYKSRNPTAQSVACSTITVAQCVANAQAAKRISSAGAVTWATPQMAAMVSAHFTVTAGATALPNRTVGDLFHAGAVTSGATGVLQRLVALRIGAAASFPGSYAMMVWNRYHGNGGNLASLLNSSNIVGGTPGGGWDEARLLKWLDYSLNPIPL